MGRSPFFSLKSWIRYVSLGAILFSLAIPQSSIFAASSLTITPNAWNVIGLDSNSPATGPYRFPIGARLHNTSSSPVTATVNFYWDDDPTQTHTFWADSGHDPYINLRDGSNKTLTIAIPAGGYADAYFEVQVLQNSSAFDQTRRYHITASPSDGSGDVSTPQPRELYVEHLISQNRNGVVEIQLDTTTIPVGGTMNLLEGHTYDITISKSFTATQGYNQFEDFINLPNTVFQVNSVSTNYSANNSGLIQGGAQPVTNYPYLYADACGWDNDPTSPTYRSCIVNSLWKTGGNEVSTTYNVTILPGSPTTDALNTLLYDFSGSSFHYNSDALSVRYYTVVDPTQVNIAKSFDPRAYDPASADHSTMTLTFSNPTGVPLDGIQIKDLFPTGSPGNMSLYDTTVGGTCTATVLDYDDNSLNAGDVGISVSGITLGPNSSCTVTVNVKVAANGTYTNTTEDLFVKVNGVETDTNKTSTDTLNVGATQAPPTSCGGGTPPVTLAKWNFDSLATGQNLGSINADSTAGDVSSAQATYGAGTQTWNDSGIVTTATNFFLKDVGSTQYLHPGSPIPSSANVWGIEAGNVADAGGWPTNAPPTGAAPYFEFSVDAGNYGGLQITASANVQGSWANSGSWYVFSATGSSSYTQAGADTWNNNWSGNKWGTIPAASITPPANATTTHFRITFNGASKDKRDPTVFLDDVTITGCKYPPEPTFSKAFDAGSIVEGSSSQLTFTIDNTTAGSQALYNLSFTDTLPLGLDVGSLVSNSCGGTVTPTNNAYPTRDTITLSGTNTLAASTSCTIVVDVTGTTQGHYDNTSGFLYLNGTPTKKYAEDALDVVAPPVISKAFAPASILTGGTSTLTFTITNPNNFTSLTGIDFTDSGAGWPAGLTATNGTTNDVCGTGSSLVVSGGDSIALSGGSLVANGSCSFDITVTGTSAGTQTNTTDVVAAAGPIVLTGNTATADLTVNDPVPLISLNKEVSTNGTDWYKYVGLVPSHDIYYRFTISNEGEVALSNISVTDPSLTMCSLPTSLAIGASASCTVGPISVTTAPTPDPYANTATVTTTTYDTSSDPVTSTAKYGTESVSIAKSVTETYFSKAGDTLHYSYRVTNTGGYPLLAPVTVTDDKVGTVSCATPANGEYLEPSESVSCPASGTVTYTVISGDVTAGYVTNQAYATVSGVQSNTDSKTVPFIADLTVTKTNNVSGTTSMGSSPFTWTLQVNNSSSAGTATFANTQTLLQDDLPSTGATYSAGNVTESGGTTGPINCSIASNTLTCTTSGSVTIPRSGSFSVPITVTSTAAGSLTNPRSAGICRVDPNNAITESNESNNDCSDTVTVLAAPTIAKSFNPATTQSGGTSQVTLTLSNSNGSDLTGASFTDTLANMSAVAGSVTGTCVGTTPSSLTGGATSLSFSGITIPANGSCTVIFSVTSSTLGVNPNSTSGVTTTEVPTAGSTSNTANLTVLGPPTIAKAFSPAIITLGSTSTITFTLTNPNASALSNASFSDTLANMAISGNQNAGGTCTGANTNSFSDADTSLSFSGISISASSSCTVTILVTSSTLGVNPNSTSGVTTTEVPTAGSVSNTANLTVNALSAPTIVKAFSPATITSGSTSTITFTLTNPNASALSNASFSDTLANMAISGNQNAGGTCTGANTNSFSDADTSLSFSGISISASSSCTVTILVTSSTLGVNPNSTSGVTTTEVPTAGSTSNTANLTVVQGSVDKSVTGTEQGLGADKVTIGEIVTYQVVLDVPAGATFPSSWLTDQLPVNQLAFVDCSQITAGSDVTSTKTSSTWIDFTDSNNCAPGTTAPANPLISNSGGTISLDLGDISNSGATTEHITLTYRAVVLDVASNVGTPTTSLTNTATWTSRGNPNAYSDQQTVKVIEPLMDIQKSASPTALAGGNPVTFSLTIGHTTQSTADAYDVVVTDVVPAGVTYDFTACAVTSGGLTPTTTTCNSGTSTITFTFDTFPRNQTATISFDAMFTGTSSSVTNTANLLWTSLPIDPTDPNYNPRSQYSSASRERTYDPTTAVDNYGSSSSVTIGLPGTGGSSGGTNLKASLLPSTGFTPSAVTVLPEQPVTKAYTDISNLWLEVPSLGVKMPIVGIPQQSDGIWDVTWLSSQAGWLQGSAFPTWSGNSVLTGHVYDANGLPGPFVDLHTLKWGDQVIIHFGSQRYIYEVRENKVVSSNDVTIFKHEDYPWLTLLTCKDYNANTDTYAHRVAIGAILVKVEAAPDR